MQVHYLLLDIQERVSFVYFIVVVYRFLQADRGIFEYLTGSAGPFIVK